MRLTCSRSKHSATYYVIESVYKKEGGTTRIVERLGSVEQMRARAGSEEPLVWARNYVQELTRLQEEATSQIPPLNNPRRHIPILRINGQDVRRHTDNSAVANYSFQMSRT